MAVIPSWVWITWQRILKNNPVDFFSSLSVAASVFVSTGLHPAVFLWTLKRMCHLQFDPTELQCYNSGCHLYDASCSLVFIQISKCTFTYDSIAFRRASNMGMHFIWQKINVRMCFLLTRMVSKGYWAIKYKTTKWVLTLVCIILHSSVPRRLMCIYCVAWQLHLIKAGRLDFNTHCLGTGLHFLSACCVSFSHLKCFASIFVL